MRAFSPECPGTGVITALAAAITLSVALTIPGAARGQSATFLRAEGVLSQAPAATYYGIAVGSAGVFVAAGTSGILEFPVNAAAPVPFGALPTGAKIVSVTVDPATGNVYAADIANSQLDVITPAGVASQLPVNGSTTVAASQVSVANGILYLAGTGGVSSVALSGGTASVISATAYNAVAVDSSGNVFVASASGASVAVFRGGTGSPVTITGPTWVAPEQLAVDASGNLYVGDDTGGTSNNGQLVKVTTPAGVSPAASQLITVDTTFAQVAPYGVAVDANGNVYWTNQGQTPPANLINVVGTQSATFPSLAVGGPGLTMSFLFSVTGSGTFGTPLALTRGASGSDFTAASDTCHGALTSGATCAVNVAFAPAAAGLRPGAVELTNSSNAPVATAYTAGWGAAGAIAFPPTYSTLSTVGDFSFGGIASDGTDLDLADNTAVRRIKMAGGASDGNLTLNGSNALDLQLDGAGNIWVADSAGVEEAVRQGNGTYAAFTNPISIAEPVDLLVDKLGNVFLIASDSNSVLEYPTAGGGPITIAAGGACNSQCDGLGLDAFGDFYYSINHVPQKVPAQSLNGTANPAATALTGISAAFDYTFDAAGDLFTISPSTGIAVEYPSQNGVLSTTSVALNAEVSAAFSGIFLDAAGNLYAADVNTGTVNVYTASTPPTLAFGNQNQGVTSAVKTTTLTNIGNLPLGFAPPAASLATGTVFALDGSATCTATSPVATGSSCTVAATFRPSAAGSQSDTITLHSTALPAPGTIALTGTGVDNSPTIALATSGTLTYGNAISVTVTASGSSGTPTGNISWTLDGTSQTAVALAGGAATLTPANAMGAGSHTVVITYPGDGTYSALSGDASETITFSVGAKPLTASLTGTVSKVYDGTNSATLTAGNIGLAGVVGNDAVSATAAAATYATTAVGSGLTVTATGITLSGAAMANYALASTSAGGPVGVITAAPVTVTASSPSFTYGNTVPAITAAYAGFLNGDTVTTAPTCSTTATSASNVGSYPSACSGAAAGNYSFTYIQGSVTVNSLPMTVTAANATMVQGTSVPAITGTGSAIINGVTQSVPFDFLSGVTCSTTATSSSPVGVYPTSCAGTFANTSLTFVSGTLSVTPAAPSVPATVVGQTSATFPVTFLFTAATPVAKALIASGGAGDYSTADGGNCVASFTVGETCTVDLSFLPAAVGDRPGAVELLDGSNNILQTVYFSGVGQGALITAPGQFTGTYTQLDTGSTGMTTDSNGDLFEHKTNGQVWKFANAVWSQLFTTNTTDFNRGMAVDAAGNLYFANSAVGGVQEYVRGPSGAYTAATPIAGTGTPATGVAVDGLGDVFYTDSQSVVHEVTAAGATVNLGSGLVANSPIAVDSANNIYAAISVGVAKITPAGVQTVIPYKLNLGTIAGLQVDASGNVLLSVQDVSATSALNEITDNGQNSFTLTTSNLASSLLGTFAFNLPNTLFAEYGQVLWQLDVTGSMNAALAFASTNFGQTAKLTRAFVNSGSTALQFSTIATGSANFAVDAASTCTTASPLAAGASCNLIVDFTPTSVGPLTDTLTVVSNSIANAHLAIPLGGTATPAPQTITFTPPASVTYGTMPITLSATGGGGSSPVVLTLGANSPATLGADGVTLTITGAGAVTINANQAADANHAAAAQLTKTITVNKAPLTVTANNATRTYGAPNPAFTATTAGFVNGDPASVVSGNPGLTTTATTATDVGTAPIAVNVSAMSAANYRINGVNGILSITQASQTITSFPLVVVGAAVPGTVLTLTATASSGLQPSFQLDAGPATLAGNQLTITGAGTVTVEADQAGNNDYSAAPAFKLSFFAGVATAVVGPASMAFGSQRINTTSRYQRAGMTNLGTAPMLVESATATGPFTVLNHCALSFAGLIPVNGFCSIFVQFTPTSTGDATGTLTITSTGAATPQTIALSGTGAAPNVSLDSAITNFGSQAVGTASLGHTVTIHNTGTVDLHITAINVVNGDGTPSSNFTAPSAAASGCATVAAASSCSITVNFTPAALGQLAAGVVLTDDTVVGKDTAVVLGTGVPLGISFSPATETFPATLVGATSNPQTVTMTYTGSGPLTGISLATSGDFALTASLTTCATTLAAAAPNTPVSCNIGFTATPTLGGSEDGSLQVSDSAGAQTVALSVTGLAPSASLSQSLLQFGSQQVNTTSDAQSVELANLGGADLAGVTISASAGFTFNTACGQTVLAGAKCGINVSFAPTQAGPASGTLTIMDSAGTQAVELSGAGQVAAGLTITPTVLGIGFVAPFAFDGLATVQQGTLTNNSGAPLLPFMSTTGNVNFAGDEQSVCDDMSENDIPLSPGASCSFSFIAGSASFLGSLSGTITASSGNLSTTAEVAAEGNPLIRVVWPNGLQFGTVAIGAQSSAQTVTVTGVDSDNASPLGLSTPIGVYSPTTTGDFTITSTTCGFVFLKDDTQSCTINVALTPTAAGTVTGSLNIQSNNGPVTIPLVGSGKAAAGLSAAPTSLNFGGVPVGAAAATSTLSSAPQTVTLTNPNNGTVGISNIQVTGGGFVETTTCGASIPANRSCTLSVSFAPTSQGAAQGKLIISDATGATNTITLAGYGAAPGITLTPAKLSFGTVPPGTSSAPQTVRLTNTSGGTITNLAVTASGGYSATTTCGTSLANGASCQLQVTMTPSSSDTVTGGISFSGSLTSTTASVALRGARAADTTTPPITGLTLVALSGGGTPATLGLSAATLTFASEPVGTASAAQTVTLTNTGTGAAITGLALTTTPDFPLTTTCTATLSVGANCTASVAFDPTAAGGRTGALAITAAGGLTAQVDLSGTATGGLLSLNPSSLTFAAIPVATQSYAQSVAVTNSGTAALHLQTLAVTGSGFAIANSTCGSLPATLAAGAGCTVNLAYTPSATAPVSGSLTASSDAGNAIIALSGSGTTQGLEFSATTFAFGNQGVGLASAAQTLTLTNASGAALAITSIAGSGDFNQSNNCPASLANGAICTVQITLTPSAAGAESGALTVNDGGITQMAALSGTGTNFTLAAPAGSASGVTIAAGNSGSFTIALTPGSFSGPVSLTCSGLPAATTCTANPATVTLAAGTSATTVTVTLTTSSRSAGLPALPFTPPTDPKLWFALAALLAVAAMIVGRRRRLAFGLLLLGALAAAGCGGSPTNEPNANGGTPSGTYPAVVTATAGKAQQSVTVPVIIL